MVLREMEEVSRELMHHRINLDNGRIHSVFDQGGRGTADPKATATLVL